MTDRQLVQPAASPDGDPWLLTPGPLTTSSTVKRAMLHDYGSRDIDFIKVNARIRNDLVGIVNGSHSHVCVPLQGSGTFIVEAMLTTFIPRQGKVLTLINGAYGRRMADICRAHQRTFETQQTPEDVPVDPDHLDRALTKDPDISHVAVVHCETTTGILNPIAAISQITARHGRALLIDAMSTFGALSLDAVDIRFDAVVASSNKCLEGSPGMGFCIARRDALVGTRDNAGSVVRDLHEQWRSMEDNGQWRFTPPTHTVLALAQALTEFHAEGGVQGRGERYRRNCEMLINGMRELGFRTLLPDDLQAPVIITFLVPADPHFQFESFYDALRQRGYVIYPGKLTSVDSFRIGCIGRITTDEIRGVLQAVREALVTLNVKNRSPSP